MQQRQRQKLTTFNTLWIKQKTFYFGVTLSYFNNLSKQLKSDNFSCIILETDVKKKKKSKDKKKKKKSKKKSKKSKKKKDKKSKSKKPKTGY